MRCQHFESAGWNWSCRKINFGASVGSQGWKGQERSELTIKEQSEQEGKEDVVLVQMTERFTWHPQATAYCEAVSLSRVDRSIHHPALFILFEALYVLTNTGYVRRTLKITSHQIQGWQMKKTQESTRGRPVMCLQCGGWDGKRAKKKAQGMS